MLVKLRLGRSANLVVIGVLFASILTMSSALAIAVMTLIVAAAAVGVFFRRKKAKQ